MQKKISLRKLRLKNNSDPTYKNVSLTNPNNYTFKIFNLNNFLIWENYLIQKITTVYDTNFKIQHITTHLTILITLLSEIIKTGLINYNFF